MTTHEQLSTGTVTIRGQRFAQFGRYLADLTPFEYETPRGDKYTCTPIADDEGRYAAIFPDEGRSALVCRFTNHTRGRQSNGHGPFRWIYADEQNASNQEVIKRTSEMLDNGTISAY